MGDRRDDIPVVRVDSEPYRVTTTTVDSIPPRRRRRELALVAAVVAVVGGVGLLGDGSDRPEDAAAATTTTTERRTSTTVRRTTTRVVPGSTTTTSWPKPLAGSGPLLPGPPTGTRVAIVHSSGRVSVRDLDTGAGCTTDPPGTGLWQPLQAPARRWLLAQTDRSLLAIDAECAVTDLDVGADGDAYPVAATTSAVWLLRDTSGTAEVREHALDTGDATGRTVQIPAYAGANVVAAGERLVIAVHGDMTLVDPATGRRRSLGSGMPVAATADALALVSCRNLECHLALADLDTGDRRRLADGPWVAWEPGAFSPDGRQLRASLASTGDEPVPVLVDVASGDVRRLPAGLWGTSFTADGAWLIGQHNGRASAFRVDGEGEVVDLDLADVSGLALLSDRY